MPAYKYRPSRSAILQRPELAQQLQLEIDVGEFEKKKEIRLESETLEMENEPVNDQQKDIYYSDESSSLSEISDS